MPGIKTAIAALALFFGAQADAAPMTFESTCTGNAVESCFIYALGEIDREAPERFADLMAAEEFEQGQIVLHSSGGNLGAGVRLGRMIRERGMTAMVGEAKRRPPGAVQLYEFPTKGSCSSACAYAFLGGTTRRLLDNSQLGFHRFYMGAPGAGSSGSAQQVSGQLVSYLVEMDVDPRIFAKASSEGADSMYWVSPQEAEDFDLITPFGYEPFFMEPYGNGVVAAAKRKTPPVPYDNIFQVTAFCRSGQAKLLFTSTYAPESPRPFWMDLDGTRHDVAAEAVSTRTRGETGFLEVTLDRTKAAALTSATQVETGFSYSRAEGGFFQTRLELAEMDRKMLDAAFRLCL